MFVVEVDDVPEDNTQLPFRKRFIFSPISRLALLLSRYGNIETGRSASAYRIRQTSPLISLITFHESVLFKDPQR